ncbi:hypothetical protein [Thermocrinis sp.]|jgi:hypothetical protein|uniref:hypothetical protein n=1 Tax=Thermocrinis sp. TaxID=2024383 RepID=UPI003C126BEC
MGNKVRLGICDAVGKLYEIVEVDEGCISISVEGKVSVLADTDCEEVWEVIRGRIVRVIEEEEEEGEEE